MINRDDILKIAAELDPTAGKGIGKSFILKPDDVVELVSRALLASVKAPAVPEDRNTFEVTDEMLDAAQAAVPDLYRVDASNAIEAALSVVNFEPGEINQLIEFFRGEGHEFGWFGDSNRWTPVQTAIHTMRTAMAKESK